MIRKDDDPPAPLTVRLEAASSAVVITISAADGERLQEFLGEPAGWQGTWSPLRLTRTDRGAGPQTAAAFRLTDAACPLEGAPAAQAHSVHVIVATGDTMAEVRQALLELQFRDRPTRAALFETISKVPGRLFDKARLLDLPISEVEGYQRIESLHPELRRAFCEERLSWSHAQTIAELGPTVQNRLADVMEQTGQVTDEDIHLAEQVKRQVISNALSPLIFDGPSEVTNDFVNIDTASAERLADMIERFGFSKSAAIRSGDAEFLRGMVETLRGIV